MEGKIEMEDRAVAGRNLLSDGYHHSAASGGVFAVLDGVGSRQGSAHASSAVAYALTELPENATAEDAADAIRRVHYQLCAEGHTATTATGILLRGGYAGLFHVGNTRAYALVNGYLRPLTTDHTESMRLLAAGLTEEEIPEKSRSTITACVGAGESMLDPMVVEDISAVAGAARRLMLCSDGIHDFLSDEELESFLSGDMTYAAIRQLVQKAVAAGSQDDITIMTLELKS